MQPESEPHALNGLSAAEAGRRLAEEGPNELAQAKRRSLLGLIVDVLKEPMLLLLLAAGGIYLLLGDVHDALVLIAFAGLTILIEIVQEGRADRAIDALRALDAPQAHVIREGHREAIPAREVVRGDLLLVGEGDRIAADGWIVAGDAMQVDEAVLTGEAVPVVKRQRTPADTGEPPQPGGDGVPYAFAGTLVVRGNATVEVAATGPRSRIGGIGHSLAGIESEAPRLKTQTRRLVVWFAALGLGVSVLVAVLYGLFRGGWLDAALAGIAIAMSMLPEELPVVLTLFMTLGALRMTRVRVLARRGAAIEALGAATVLCTDKTGTLTQNRMEIAELRLPDGERFTPGGGELVLPAGFVELTGLGILASLEQPFDPMETAFHDLGERHDGEVVRHRQQPGWSLRRQYPLSPELLAVSHVWGGQAGERVVAAKGAPEAIAGLCGMAGPARDAMMAMVGEMGAEGLRVLAVGEARWPDDALPDTPHEFDFAFRGLVGLRDPIREAVPGAVAALRQAGIRVVMITGDYPVTARAIADQAGIREGAVMTGAELATIDDEALAARIGQIAVFARIMPEAKLRIVRALQGSGEIVAMTGDGVNDAPSLKAAHIGVAMGKRGTDVAREASAIVLLDDDFHAIPAAVALGRRIYDNLRKAMGFIFAVHLPIGAMALAPLLFGWPILLGPAHIAMLEMIIDPVCSLAFEAEPEERNIMRRPPRDPAAPLFPRRLLAWSILQGVVAIVLLLGLATWAFASGEESVEQVRTTVFAGLVAVVLVLVAANRSFTVGRGIGNLRANRPLLAISAVVLVFFALLFGVPAVAGLFRFAPLESEAALAAVAAAGVLAVVLAMAKPAFRRALEN